MFELYKPINNIYTSTIQQCIPFTTSTQYKNLIVIQEKTSNIDFLLTSHRNTNCDSEKSKKKYFFSITAIPHSQTQFKNQSSSKTKMFKAYVDRNRAKQAVKPQGNNQTGVLYYRVGKNGTETNFCNGLEVGRTTRLLSLMLSIEML